MGQFSWLDCVTDEQVIDNKRRDVYVLVPKKFTEQYGERILETYYDGYGRFGGYDIYDLIADWNREFIPIMLQYVEKGMWKCGMFVKKEDLIAFYNGENYSCEKREIGIMMGCYDEDNMKLFYPIKITHKSRMIYEDCVPSLADPNQGWGK